MPSNPEFLRHFEAEGVELARAELVARIRMLDRADVFDGVGRGQRSNSAGFAQREAPQQAGHEAGAISVTGARRIRLQPGGRGRHLDRTVARGDAVTVKSPG